MSNLADAIPRQPHEMEDPELGVCRGDVDAMAELFTKHKARFAQIVRFRMNPQISARVDIEDVLQEAFLDAVKRIKHFQDDTTMSPFVRLREIILQTLTDVHRRHLGVQGRDCSREVNLTGTQGAYDTSACIGGLLAGNFTSPLSAAMRKEIVSQLQAALAGMEPIDCEVLMMRHFEDLSNKEVSEALQIKTSAASRRYIRAIKRLGNVLNSMA